MSSVDASSAAYRQFAERARNGGPLSELFDQFGQLEAQTLIQEILSGLFAGVNPRQMARELSDAIDALDYGRAETIMRTEMLGSWNDAALENYRANSDVVGQWMWMCTPGAGTCVSCLEEDGTIYDLDEELDDHPNGRCCKAPVTNDYGSILDEYGIPWEEGDFGPGPWDDRVSGEDWLLAQDVETQRAAFGSNASYNAWKSGDVKLSDFVGVRKDAVWGDSIEQKSLRSMGLDAKDYSGRVAVEAVPKEVEAAAGTLTVDEMRKESEAIARLIDPYGEREDAGAVLQRVIRDLDARLAGNADFQAFVERDWADRLTPLAAGESRSQVTIENLLRNWGGESSKGDLAAALQLAAREEFDLKGASLAFDAEAAASARAAYGAEEAGLRALLRSMYENTQDYLAKHDINEVILYRGLGWHLDDPHLPKGVEWDGTGALREVALQPLSSFASDPYAAGMFAGGERALFIGDRIPAEDILSLGQTGFGVLPESEFVLLGGQHDLLAVAYDPEVLQPSKRELQELLAQASAQHVEAVGEGIIKEAASVEERAAATTAVYKAELFERVAASAVDDAKDATYEFVDKREDSATIKDVFGRKLSNADLGALVGARTGDEVLIETIDVSDASPGAFSVFNIQMTSERAEAVLEVKRTTEGIIIGGDISVTASERGAASGLDIVRGMAHMQEMGVKELDIEALRAPGANGYITWARLGFTGDIPTEVLADVQAKFGDDITRVEQLMEKPGGSAWWRENGVTWEAKFDFTPGSYSMQTLEPYLERLARGLDSTALEETAAQEAEAQAARAATAAAGRAELHDAIDQAMSGGLTREAYDREVLAPLADRLAGNQDWQRLLEKMRSGDMQTISESRLRSDEIQTAEGAVKTFIDRWTIGSDTPEAAAMRLAAISEFNLPNDLASVTKDAEVLARVQSDYGDVLGGVQALLRAMHDQTQEWFDQRGIESVRLYRGLSAPEAPGAAVRAVAAEVRPISSFSADLGLAAEFASQYGELGRVYALDVPVSRILATPMTGLGEAEKWEALLLGGNYDGVMAGGLKYPGSLEAWDARIAELEKSLSGALRDKEGFALREGEGAAGQGAGEDALRARIDRIPADATVPDIQDFVKAQLPGIEGVDLMRLDAQTARLIANASTNLIQALPDVANNIVFMEAKTTYTEALANVPRDGLSLIINADKWTDLASLAERAQYHFADGWWVNQTPEQVIGHEIGHMLQVNYKIADYTWVEAMDRVALAGGNPLVSTYAGDKIAESFAETFSLLVYGEPTDAQLPIVREMARVLREHNIDYNTLRAAVGESPISLAYS